MDVSVFLPASIAPRYLFFWNLSSIRTFQPFLRACFFNFRHTTRQLIMSAMSNLESLHLDRNLIVDVPPSLRSVAHALNARCDLSPARAADVICLQHAPFARTMSMLMHALTSEYSHCLARYLSNMTRLTLAYNKLKGKWAYFPISALRCQLLLTRFSLLPKSKEQFGTHVYVRACVCVCVCAAI